MTSRDEAFGHRPAEPPAGASNQDVFRFLRRHILAPDTRHGEAIETQAIEQRL
jgi:hypothetical protein